MNSNSVKDKSSVARPPKQKVSFTGIVAVSSSYGNYRVEIKVGVKAGEIDKAISQASAAIDKALKKRQDKQIREVKVRDRLKAKRKKHREYMQGWRDKQAKQFIYHNEEITFDSNGGDHVFGQRAEKA